jgi:hypothetical protein
MIDSYLRCVPAGTREKQATTYYTFCCAVVLLTYYYSVKYNRLNESNHYIERAPKEKE